MMDIKFAVPDQCIIIDWIQSLEHSDSYRSYSFQLGGEKGVGLTKEIAMLPSCMCIHYHAVCNKGGHYILPLFILLVQSM